MSWYPDDRDLFENHHPKLNGRDGSGHCAFLVPYRHSAVNVEFHSVQQVLLWRVIPPLVAAVQLASVFFK